MVTRHDFLCYLFAAYVTRSCMKVAIPKTCLLRIEVIIIRIVKEK